MAPARRSAKGRRCFRLSQCRQKRATVELRRHGRAEPRQRLLEVVVDDVGQTFGNARCRGSVGAFGWCSRGATQRGLAQRDAFDGAPAREAVDALADDAGESGFRLPPGPRRAAQEHRAAVPTQRPIRERSLCPIRERGKNSLGPAAIGPLSARCEREISAPTISVQRVTSSAEAKPWRVNVSPTTLPRRSRNGLANEREGLLHGAVLCHPSIMRPDEARSASRVAANAAARQRAQGGTAISYPQPTALFAW